MLPCHSSHIHSAHKEGTGAGRLCTEGARAKDKVLNKDPPRHAERGRHDPVTRWPVLGSCTVGQDQGIEQDPSHGQTDRTENITSPQL